MLTQKHVCGAADRKMGQGRLPGALRHAAGSLMGHAVSAAARTCHIATECVHPAPADGSPGGTVLTSVVHSDDVNMAVTWRAVLRPPSMQSRAA